MINVTNTVILLIYIGGVFTTYSMLYWYFSSYDIYPYKKAPLFYSIILSVFIAPALFVLLQIDNTGHGPVSFKIIPNFKSNRRKVQYCDSERLNNIWYCNSNSKFGPSISNLLYDKFKSIYKR